MGHERLTLFTVGAGETVHPGSSHFTEEEELFNQKIESISKLKKEKICSIWDSWPSISGETALTYNHGCSIREMMRESPEKIASLKDGSIRPFLLLVSMHPRRRAFLAFQVGLDLFKRASYGDSHKEARYIITASRTGIQGRTNEAWSETINPLGHNSNWWSSLFWNSSFIAKPLNFVLYRLPCPHSLFLLINSTYAGTIPAIGRVNELPNTTGKLTMAQACVGR